MDQNISVPDPFKMDDCTGELTGTTIPLRHVGSSYSGTKYLPLHATSETWPELFHDAALHPWDKSVLVHSLDAQLRDRTTVPRIVSKHNVTYMIKGRRGVRQQKVWT